MTCQEDLVKLSLLEKPFDRSMVVILYTTPAGLGLPADVVISSQEKPPRRLVTLTIKAGQKT